jgi:hypothetical protein
LNTISELEPDKFTKVVKRFPKHFEKEKLIRARPLENGLFVEANFSAKSAYRFCQLVIEEAGLTSDDWRIKYNR